MLTHRCALLATAVLSLSGCAFIDRRIDLPAHERNVQTPWTDACIVVGEFQDKRSQPRVVAHLQNSWGIHTADVVTDHERSVRDWVRRYFELELADEDRQCVEPLVLSGEIHLAFVERSGFGKLGIRLRLTRRDALIFERKFDAKYHKTEPTFDPTPGLLRGALRELGKAALPMIVEAAEREMKTGPL